jgi:hypothetical protein
MPGKRKPQASSRKGSPRTNSQRIAVTKRVRPIALSKLTERSFSARARSQHALNVMRRGASLSTAARDNRVSAPTIKKYVGSALVQDRPGGRIRATKGDRFVRNLQLPGLQGPVDADTHGKKEAREAAKYLNDVNRFFGGDLNALAPWRGKKIAGIELITDGQTLKGLAQDELLPYSLYRSLSRGA